MHLCSTFGRRTNDETEVNKGYARVTVPKVVANLSLDRPWPVLDRPLRLLGRRGKGDVHERCDLQTDEQSVLPHQRAAL